MTLAQYATTVSKTSNIKKAIMQNLPEKETKQSNKVSQQDNVHQM